MTKVQEMPVSVGFLDCQGSLAHTAKQSVGGGSGIRTHDTVSRIHAFQACALSHSAIPPKLMRSRNIALHARVTNLLYGRGRVCIGTNKNAQLTQRTLPASLTS